MATNDKPLKETEICKFVIDQERLLITVKCQLLIGKWKEVLLAFRKLSLFNNHNKNCSNKSHQWMLSLGDSFAKEQDMYKVLKCLPPILLLRCKGRRLQRNKKTQLGN